MKNYNIFALRGDDSVSDYEVCDTLGLDRELAGTPAINEAAISKMHKQNVEGYKNKGYDDSKAVSMANALADNTRRKLKLLMQ